MSAADDSRIPVTLLTGFLGSGKTTILNHLLQHPALANALVIINEFGEIGLDHALLVHTNEDVVVEMSSGCLCCTIRGDLSKTLREAPWRFARNGKRWFERVVIETTGIADPVPVMHTLMMDPKVETLYRLDGVITTVDAATALTTLDRQFESIKQAAVADMLLLTKTDLTSSETTEFVEARLHELNPAAPIVRTTQGAVDPALLFGTGLHMPAARTEDVKRWLSAEAYEHETKHGHDHDEHHHHDVNRHGKDISAVCVTVDDPIHPEVFNGWLGLLAAFRGPDLLRIKGMVNIIGEPGPVVIHGVQHIFHPSQSLPAWPDDDRRSRIVFIGRNLPADKLRESLAVLVADYAARHPSV
ncbi:G3E family GTPase [Rhizomicrobium palustre]|uniref:G3E family GTPase n=1 Tax=Rhizomicrobium palustre TaxID=189966 RepID=A0A846N3Y9_9PROT|nr:GTP-binding protein [Rhizomicrobium palustre]NIK89817.1 G3E family GTPase [Rhizomicrobium palustre]